MLKENILKTESSYCLLHEKFESLNNQYKNEVHEKRNLLETYNSYEKKFDLRYGENPHQNSAYYVSTTENGSMKHSPNL